MIVFRHDKDVFEKAGKGQDQGLSFRDEGRNGHVRADLNPKSDTQARRRIQDFFLKKGLDCFQERDKATMPSMCTHFAGNARVRRPQRFLLLVFKQAFIYIQGLPIDVLASDEI